MTSPAAPLPRFLLTADLPDVYGLASKTLDRHRRRGLIPDPDATCRAGELWDEPALLASRVMPRPDLAAIAPIDPDLGLHELSHHGVYVCPDHSGSHIGWASPSILGAYHQGDVTWYRVVGIARYGPGQATPYAYTTNLSAARLARASTPIAVRVAKRASGEHPRVAFVLDHQHPLGTGPVDAGRSANGGRLGLRQGRLLRVNTTSSGPVRVGATGHWLTLKTRLTLATFTLPDLETAFPL